MKLSHIFIYLFAGTFAGRILMMYQEEDKGWAPLIGLGILLLLIVWALYKWDKKQL